MPPKPKKSLAETEGGLLRLYNQERQSRAKPLGQAQPISRMVLKEWDSSFKKRTPAKKNSDANIQAGVKGLPKQLTVATSDGQRIADLTDHRKESHDAEVHSYREHVQSFANDYQTAVTDAAQSFKDKLRSSEEDIELSLSRLEDHSIAHFENLEQLESLWARIKDHLPQRQRWIDELNAHLETLERDFTKRMEQELKRLAERLTVIAHMLPEGIERFLQSEQHEFNLGLIEHRRSMMKVFAKLHAVDHERERRQCTQWNQRCFEWRQLKHEFALSEFKRIMCSAEINDPPQRQEILGSFRTELRGLLDERLELLHILLSFTDTLFKEESVTDWLDRLAKVSERIRCAHSDLIDALQENESYILWQCQEQRDALAVALDTCAHIPPAQRAELVEETCTPAIQARQKAGVDFVFSIERYVVQQHESATEACRAVGEYVLRAAQLRDSNIHQINDAWKDTNEKRESIEAEHEHDIARQEGLLDKVVAEMQTAHSSNEGAVQLKLTEALECLDSIEGLHRTAREHSLEHAAEWPTTMQTMLEAYTSELREVLHLTSHPLSPGLCAEHGTYITLPPVASTGPDPTSTESTPTSGAVVADTAPSEKEKHAAAAASVGVGTAGAGSMGSGRRVGGGKHTRTSSPRPKSPHGTSKGKSGERKPRGKRDKAGDREAHGGKKQGGDGKRGEKDKEHQHQGSDRGHGTESPAGEPADGTEVQSQGPQRKLVPYKPAIITTGGNQVQLYELPEAAVLGKPHYAPPQHVYTEADMGPNEDDSLSNTAPDEEADMQRRETGSGPKGVGTGLGTPRVGVDGEVTPSADEDEVSKPPAEAPVPPPISATSATPLVPSEEVSFALLTFIRHHAQQTLCDDAHERAVAAQERVTEDAETYATQSTHLLAARLRAHEPRANRLKLDIAGPTEAAAKARRVKLERHMEASDDQVHRLERLLVDELQDVEETAAAFIQRCAGYRTSLTMRTAIPSLNTAGAELRRAYVACTEELQARLGVPMTELGLEPVVKLAVNLSPRALPLGSTVKAKSRTMGVGAVGAGGRTFSPSLVQSLSARSSATNNTTYRRGVLQKLQSAVHVMNETDAQFLRDYSCSPEEQTLTQQLGEARRTTLEGWHARIETHARTYLAAVGQHLNTFLQALAHRLEDTALLEAANLALASTRAKAHGELHTSQAAETGLNTLLGRLDRLCSRSQARIRRTMQRTLAAQSVSVQDPLSRDPTDRLAASLPEFDALAQSDSDDYDGEPAVRRSLQAVGKGGPDNTQAPGDEEEEEVVIHMDDEGRRVRPPPVWFQTLETLVQAQAAIRSRAHYLDCLVARMPAPVQWPGAATPAQQHEQALRSQAQQGKDSAKEKEKSGRETIELLRGFQRPTGEPLVPTLPLPSGVLPLLAGFQQAPSTTLLNRIRLIIKVGRDDIAVQYKVYRQRLVVRYGNSTEGETGSHTVPLQDVGAGMHATPRQSSAPKTSSMNHAKDKTVEPGTGSDAATTASGAEGSSSALATAMDTAQRHEDGLLAQLQAIEEKATQHEQQAQHAFHLQVSRLAILLQKHVGPAVLQGLGADWQLAELRARAQARGGFARLLSQTHVERAQHGASLRADAAHPRLAAELRDLRAREGRRQSKEAELTAHYLAHVVRTLHTYACQYVPMLTRAATSLLQVLDGVCFPADLCPMESPITTQRKSLRRLLHDRARATGVAAGPGAQGSPSGSQSGAGNVIGDDGSAGAGGRRDRDHRDRKGKGGSGRGGDDKHAHREKDHKAGSSGARAAGGAPVPSTAGEADVAPQTHLAPRTFTTRVWASLPAAGLATLPAELTPLVSEGDPSGVAGADGEPADGAAGGMVISSISTTVTPATTSGDGHQSGHTAEELERDPPPKSPKRERRERTGAGVPRDRDDGSGKKLSARRERVEKLSARKGVGGSAPPDGGEASSSISRSEDAAVTSLDTPAHAATMVARDKAFGSYLEHHQVAARRIHETAKAVDQAQQEWNAHWDRLVQALQQHGAQAQGQEQVLGVRDVMDDADEPSDE